MVVGSMAVQRSFQMCDHHPLWHLTRCLNACALLSPCLSCTAGEQNACRCVTLGGASALSASWAGFTGWTAKRFKTSYLVARCVVSIRSDAALNTLANACSLLEAVRRLAATICLARRTPRREASRTGQKMRWMYFIPSLDLQASA